jgi:hypothetical protein
MSRLSLRLNSNQSKKPDACCLLYADFLLGLLFDPEDKGDMFFQNVGRLSPNYKALHPIRNKYSALTCVFSIHEFKEALELQELDYLTL